MQSLVSWNFYRPQTKFVKVMFLQVSGCPRGGGACEVGACMVEGMYGGGHTRQGGVHGGRGMHGKGACVAGGHVWQGDMHGRGCAWWGCALQSLSMAGGVHGSGGHAWHACPPAHTMR